MYVARESAQRASAYTCKSPCHPPATRLVGERELDIHIQLRAIQRLCKVLKREARLCGASVFERRLHHFRHLLFPVQPQLSSHFCMLHALGPFLQVHRHPAGPASLVPEGQCGLVPAAGH